MMLTELAHVQYHENAWVRCVNDEPPQEALVHDLSKVIDSAQGCLAEPLQML